MRGDRNTNNYVSFKGTVTIFPSVSCCTLLSYCPSPLITCLSHRCPLFSPGFPPTFRLVSSVVFLLSPFISSLCPRLSFLSFHVFLPSFHFILSPFISYSLLSFHTLSLHFILSPFISHSLLSFHTLSFHFILSPFISHSLLSYFSSLLSSVSSLVFVAIHLWHVDK